MRFRPFIALVGVLSLLPAASAPKVIELDGVRVELNYDEDRVHPYDLEDPLSFADGRKVRTKSDWEIRRREILDIFAHEMFGLPPPDPETVKTEVWDEKVSCAGFAVRCQMRMWFRKDGSGPCINWIIYRPRHVKERVPVVLFLNYRGNHTLTADADVPVPAAWCRDKGGTHRSRESARGEMTDPSKDTYLPIGSILARGYAVMSACYCEVSPDPEDDPKEPQYDQRHFAYTGVFDLWGPRDEKLEDNTTSLGAWAWALSRGVDYIRDDPNLAADGIVVTGCSRLAKAALLAAARDERIAVCVPVQTGGGGCPLAKRDFGECVATEILMFKHWYCKAYAKYAVEPWRTMPFDQHLLLASIAPRGLLVLGFNGPWFDTKGEYLAVKAASPVWSFLGKEAMPDVEWPDNYSTAAIGRHLGYARRTEEHGIAAWDWKRILDFADLIIKKE